MPSSEAVQVGVRVRPFNENERGTECCLSASLDRPVLSITAPPAVAGAAARRATLGPNAAPPPQPASSTGAVTTGFPFDHVFWSAGAVSSGPAPPDASQVDVYTAIGAPIVHHALEGFNGCLFAYGQTGSGKTHTMLGDVADDELMGVVPRICRELFDLLAEKTAAADGGGSRWTVELGFVEIYNETLNDLLAKAKPQAQTAATAAARGKTPASARGAASKSSPLQPPPPTKAAVIRESSERGVFIENQTLRPVASAAEALAAIEEASAARTVASTRMNQRSSRSHAVIQLHLVELSTGGRAAGGVASPMRVAGKAAGGILKRSVVNMVDLAGSERVKSTGAAGDQLEQAKYINLSLTTLGRVIDALANLSKKAAASSSSGSRVANLDTRPPYRESKLTFMLKSSLGGNSRTRMIAAVSPSALQSDETLSTLRYASRARDIVNVVHVNEDPLRRRIRELEAEMNTLRSELRQTVQSAPAGGVPAEYVKSLEERIELLQADADMKVEQLATAAMEHERTVLDQLYDLAQTDEERERLMLGKKELEKELEEAHAVLDAYEADLERMRLAQSEREQRHLEEIKARDEALEELQKELAVTQSRSTGHLERTITMLAVEKERKEQTIRELTAELERLRAGAAAEDAQAHGRLTGQMTVLHEEYGRINAALESATNASTSIAEAQQSQGVLQRRTDILTLIEREALSRQWLQTAAHDELAQLFRAFAIAGFAIQERCNAAVNDFLETQNDELREDLQLVVDRLHETRSHAERYALRCQELEEALADAKQRQGALEELIEASSTKRGSMSASVSPGGGHLDPYRRTPSGTGGGFSARNRANSSIGGLSASAREQSPRMPLSGRPPLSARTDASSGGGDDAPSQLLRRLKEIEGQLAAANVSLDAARDENLKFRVALMTAEVEGFDVPTELLHPDYGAVDDDGAGGEGAAPAAAGASYTTSFHVATTDASGNASFSESDALSGTGGAGGGALEGGDASWDASVMRLTGAPSSARRS